MEDLIPLIIVILISLVGAIGRKKKKSLQGTVNEAPQRKDDIFSWLEQLADSDEVKSAERVQPAEVDIIEEPQVNNATVNNKYSQYSGFITPDEKEGMMAKEGLRVNDRPKYVKHVSEIDSAKHENRLKHSIKKHSLIQHFNLKQAVVYSELLNRKY